MSDDGLTPVPGSEPVRARPRGRPRRNMGLPRDAGGKVKAVGHARTGVARVDEVIENLERIDPTYEAEAKQVGFDVEQAFQLFVQFSGDTQKTAHALNIPEFQILKLVDRLHWDKQLENIFALKKSGKPGDVERGISRAMNFVQVHKFRIVVERIVRKFYAMDDDDLFDACFTERLDKDGNVVGRVVNLKPFAELATAMEKVHQMTYMALSDSMSERTRRQEAGEAEYSATQLHQLIAAGMAGNTGPAAELGNEQLSEANATAQENKA